MQFDKELLKERKERELAEHIGTLAEESHFLKLDQKLDYKKWIMNWIVQFVQLYHTFKSEVGELDGGGEGGDGDGGEGGEGGEGDGVGEDVKNLEYRIFAIETQLLRNALEARLQKIRRPKVPLHEQIVADLFRNV